MDAETEMWRRDPRPEPSTPNPDEDTLVQPGVSAPPAGSGEETAGRPADTSAGYDPYAATHPFPRAGMDGYEDTLVQPAPPPPPPPPADTRTRGRGWSPIVASALVAAIVSSLVTLGLTRATGEDTGAAVPGPAPAVEAPGDGGGEVAPELTAGSGTVADVAETVLPSVARVDVNGATGSGSGSAVVYRSDGYLITNNHVVENAGSVSVTLPDTQVVDAEVIGSDRSSDLAVLRIENTNLTPPQFAEQQPRVGDTAIAIGSPFGLDSTVTSGIISATGRDVNAPPDVRLFGMLQTDAAINPGNSGGALVNDRGELIGINTAIVSRTGQSGGIGFAIPVSTVRDVAEQLIDRGVVTYAYLGVSTQDLNQGVAGQLGLDSTEGALVAEVVPGSPAARAGLQPGDVIVALGDRDVASSGDLVAAVRSFTPGDQGTVTWVRDGQRQQADFTFGTLPQQG